MMRLKTVLQITVLAFVLTLGFNKSFCQSLPVGMPLLDDYYRRQQITGTDKVDSNSSFSVRPLSIKILKQNFDIFDPEGDKLKTDLYTLKSKTFANGKGLILALPLTWLQQYNTHHPYGWNDGPMIPAKGYQTLVSTGFYAQYGPLSIQFKPEYVYAQNLAFPGYASNLDDNRLINYYYYHNFIDNPERFGNKPFNRASLGQSSIRLTFGSVSFGISNENLWWGPGVRNSLILSNNAPGFKHFTVKTVKPVRTFLGTFEAQVVGARLDNTNSSPLLTTTTSTGDNRYIPKRTDWRYYAGLNINYQPKWTPGLFLGLIRTFDAYHNDVKGLSGYLPFFVPYTKATINANGEEGDPYPRDQLTSLYARWLFRKAKAEVYFEYGLNDNSYNLTDFVGAPSHSRAYLVGLRKFVALNKPGEGILFSGEITQLSQTIDRFVRDAGGWYVHGEVKQGMTHYGQVLGAGTGSGGNLQSMDISWIKGLKRLGIMFERYEHDVDFYDSYISAVNLHSRKWVDFGFGLQGDWNYKNLLINAKLEGVESLNYQWILKDYVPSGYYIPTNNVFNLHAQIGLTYRF